MDIPSKSITRTFSLDIDFGCYEILTKLAKRVVESIENPEVLVYAPDDDGALFSEIVDNEEIVGAGANVPINAIEWLPVACQSIGLDLQSTDTHLAHYAYSLRGSVFPTETVTVPAGPAGFCGEIRITSRGFDRVVEIPTPSQRADAFCFIIAHELVHVFDTMKLIVPAFMDWDAFWNGPLCRGANVEDGVWGHHFDGMVLDQYGTQAELDGISQFWPSQAATWFGAFHSKD